MTQRRGPGVPKVLPGCTQPWEAAAALGTPCAAPVPTGPFLCQFAQTPCCVLYISGAGRHFPGRAWPGADPKVRAHLRTELSAWRGGDLPPLMIPRCRICPVCQGKAHSSDPRFKSRQVPAPLASVSSSLERAGHGAHLGASCRAHGKESSKSAHSNPGGWCPLVPLSLWCSV